MSYGEIAFNAWRDRWNRGLVQPEDGWLGSRGRWEDQMELTRQAWEAAAEAVLEEYQRGFDRPGGDE